MTIARKQPPLQPWPADRNSGLMNSIIATHWPEDPTPLDQGYIVINNCMYCGSNFAGPEPQMCCDGRECGCMGMPVDPVICSPACWEALTAEATRGNAVLFGGTGKLVLCSDCKIPVTHSSEIQQGMCFACQYHHAN